MSRFIVNFDMETARIRPGLQAPPPVCLQWDMQGVHAPKLIHCHLEKDRAAQWLYWALTEPTILLTGHNISYDLAVSMDYWPELAPTIYRAYDEERIVCTLVREKLHDIKIGTRRIMTYNMEDVAKRRKLTNVPDKSDEWRLRYWELKGVPISQWPADAIHYAEHDVRVGLELAMKQSDYPDQYRQSRADFWLQLAHCWGMMTDPTQVERYYESTREKLIDERNLLQEVGIVRHSGSRDTKAARRRYIQSCAVKGVKPVLTDKGKELKKGGMDPQDVIDGLYVSVSKDAVKRAADPVLDAYARFTSHGTILSRVKRLKHGYHTPIQPSFDSLVETGRTSCRQGDVDPGKEVIAWGAQVQNVHREVGLRECFHARPGHVFIAIDYKGCELHTVSQVNILMHKDLGLDPNKVMMARALNEGRDVHLWFGGQLLGIDYDEAVRRKKAGDEEVKDKRQIAKCFHRDVEVLTPQGWVKISELDPTSLVATPYVHQNKEVDIKWERPQRLTYREDQPLIRVHNEGVDLRVTPDHKMIGWAQGKQGKVKEVAAVDTAKLRYWPNAGTCTEGTWTPDERLVRLAVATQADGNYNGFKIRFGFSKKRKIERLNALCEAAGHPLVWTTRKDGRTFDTAIEKELADKVKTLIPNKEFTWAWLQMAPSLREAALEEARYWDSHTGKRSKSYVFCSRQSGNLDILQAMASITGRKTRIGPCGTKLTVRTNRMSRGGSVDTEDVGRDRVYCLTTNSGNILVRDGGVPVVTKQCADFGFPGGLGVTGFTTYATGYGLTLTESEVRVLKDLWLKSFPEFQVYFRWVRSQLREVGLNDDGEPIKRLDVTHPYSNRKRGRVPFTVACNGFFQGLAADMAKDAGWGISRECYAVPGSPLYGSRIVNFIHDEHVVEAPIDKAHHAACRMRDIMLEAGRKWCPDVPVGVDVSLMHRWTKKVPDNTIDPSTGLYIPNESMPGFKGMAPAWR